MTEMEGADRAERRARAEALLIRYPAIEQQELAELIYWARKDASALDVGMIGSDPLLGPPWRLFARDHIDRITPVDLLYAAIAVLASASMIAGIVWLAR